MARLDQANEERAPSTAHKPDLDWSQVRETVLMLNAAVAQIRNSMADGDESVTSLTNTVTGMIEKVQRIGDTAATLEDGGPKSAILDDYNAVAGRIQEVIVSFQFYDKLVQRLTHVCGGLDGLAELVSDESRLYNPSAWRGIQEEIKGHFTVETDKIMFNAILTGASVDQALELVRQAQRAEGNTAESDIELF